MSSPCVTGGYSVIILITMPGSSFFHLLLLIVVANASPIIVHRLLKDKWSYALDGGMAFIDGQPLLGNSKTWRGVITSVFITSITGTLLGYSLQTSALIALLAMTGDSVSSFVKRRLRLKPSSMALLLDQVPESLLPALVMMQSFSLSLPLVFLLVVLFLVFELTVSIILYNWGIRKRPY